jgi:hypothetical protein
MTDTKHEDKRDGWFGRLFGGRPARNGETENAIALVVESIDPRLRLVSGYSKKLRPCLEGALTHIDGIVRGIPPSVEISARAWSNDPLVRTLFADIAHMRQLFSASRELREFFHTHPLAAEAFVGLGLTREERKVLGMALTGDVLQREVAQITVGFAQPLVVGACESEAELRGKIKLRGLNFLIAEVLIHFAELRAGSANSQGKQQNLQLWLKAREHERDAVQGLFDTGEALDHEIDSLRERVTKGARLYGEPQAPIATLDESLAQVCSTLQSAPQALALELVHLRVNRMNVKVEAADAEGDEIAFAEVTIGRHPPRTVVLTRVPRDQLLPEEDPVLKAQRLLGV